MEDPNEDVADYLSVIAEYSISCCSVHFHNPAKASGLYIFLDGCVVFPVPPRSPHLLIGCSDTLASLPILDDTSSLHASLLWAWYFRIHGIAGARGFFGSAARYVCRISTTNQ